MRSMNDVLFMYYPKYDTLAETKDWIDPRAEAFDIYIDLYKIMSSLFKPDVMLNSLDPKDIKAQCKIVSSVVNLCAHYRQYYANVYSAYSRFFLVYSTGDFYSNKYYFKDYDKVNRERRENDYVKNEVFKHSAKIFETLCPYLPDIFFAKTDYEVAVKIHGIRYLISSYNTSLVMTKDPLTIQACICDDELLIFNHVKSRDNDHIVVSERKDAIENFCILMKRSLSDVSKKCIRFLDPTFFSLIVAATGYDKRSLPNIGTINGIVKLLYDLIIQDKIPNRLINPRTIYDRMSNKQKSRYDIETIVNRWKALDILIQYEWYKNSTEYEDKSYLINLDDPKELKYVNDHYFVENPLDLQRL